MNVITTILVIIVIILMLKGIIADLKDNGTISKKKQNKKKHSYKTTYYKTNIRHYDKKHDYVESIWNEIK